MLLLAAGVSVAFFDYYSEKPGARFPFRLGLDLSGGTHLVYRADVSGVQAGEVRESMDALRDVIERRVNLFGVAEPVVQVETTAGVISENKENRLIVELPGVTDVNRAIAMIGQTPLLEFRIERPESPEKEKVLKELRAFEEALRAGNGAIPENIPDTDALFVPTELTGRFLKKAILGFDSISGAPRVNLEFNEEGEALFARITREHTGKILAIYLDGAPISEPVIQEEIRGGKAEITGTFTPEEAKQLVGRLNSGALPVPIELLGSQTIGASLGDEAKTKGIQAGVLGFSLVALFMVLWYRLPGLVSVAALGIYVAAMLALFKLIPVTLTAAGIAGFILSIGMAVDANVLIFERTKEELRRGRELKDAVRDGFSRAWFSIRDSNISSILTAVILFWFGTSLIEGFALVFALGVFISMLTAITITRSLLFAMVPKEASSRSNAWFSAGIFS